MHLPAQSIRHYMIDNAETYFPCLKVLNRLNMKSKYSSSFLPVTTEWNDLVLLSNMTIEYLHDDSTSWLLPFSSSYSRTELRKYNLQGEFLSCSHLRVDDWLLMSSPWPTVGLCLLYYYIIRVAGPNYMKNREPLETTAPPRTNENVMAMVANLNRSDPVAINFACSSDAGFLWVGTSLKLFQACCGSKWKQFLMIQS